MNDYCLTLPPIFSPRNLFSPERGSAVVLSSWRTVKQSDTHIWWTEGALIALWDTLEIGHKYSFGQIMSPATPVLKGPTWHRPMAHPVVFRYLFYSTSFAEHAVHPVRRCRAGTCLFSLVQLDDQ